MGIHEPHRWKHEDVNKGTLLVKFKEGFHLDHLGIHTILEAHGATRGRSLGEHGHALRVDPKRAEALAKLLVERGLVEFAQPENTYKSTRTPNDPFFIPAAVPGLFRIELENAWNITIGSSSVSVAVFDTGVASVAGLSGKLNTGYNTADGSSNVTPPDDHGTSCAGVIGMINDDATDTAGVGWNTMVTPVKLAAFSDTDIILGLQWIRANTSVRIVSMSFAGTGSATQPLIDEVLICWNLGIVICAAAGNTGNTTINFPAGIANVVGVSGCNPTDDNNGGWNYGSWCDIVAPGHTFSYWVDGTLHSFQATSCATPVVAGVMALMLAANPGISAPELVRLITDVNNTDPVGSGFGDPPQPARKVNAHKAVRAAVTMPKLIHKVPKSHVQIHGSF